MPRKLNRSLAVLSLALCGSVLVVGPAAAQSELNGPDDQCGIGDALSIVNAAFPFF